MRRVRARVTDFGVLFTSRTTARPYNAETMHRGRRRRYTFSKLARANACYIATNGGGGDDGDLETGTFYFFLLLLLLLHLLIPIFSTR